MVSVGLWVKANGLGTPKHPEAVSSLITHDPPLTTEATTEATTESVQGSGLGQQAIYFTSNSIVIPCSAWVFPSFASGT